MKAQTERLMEVEEQSLEQLLERVERQQAREEDDREAELNILIDAIADIRLEVPAPELDMRNDEFVCRECHMIEHRSRLVALDDLVCLDCAPILVGAT